MRIVFFIGTVDIVLSTIGYIYYWLNLPWGRTWTFGLIYLLLAVHTVISVILPPSTPPLLMKLSAWLEGLWIAIIFYSLILTVFHCLLWLVSKIVGWQIPSARIATIGLICICCFIAWGSWRAFHPDLRTEHITTDKLPAGTKYKIILLSDIHLGRILGRSYALELSERVNKLQPDLVLIAGDIIDQKISYIEKEDSLTALAEIKAPLGIYMAYGNHEYFDNPSLWQQMLENQNIHVLRDADTIIDGKLKLTGLNDYMRNRSDDTLWALAGRNREFYSILIDHQPRKMLAAQAAGYDLYLAGHTHTGQLFPNRQVTKRMYLLDYGRKNFGNLTAITSNGYGFWGPPVRTEVAPEIILIELEGKVN